MCHKNAYENYRSKFLSGDFAIIAEQSSSFLDRDKNRLNFLYYAQNSSVDLATGEISSELYDFNDTDKIIIWNYLVNARGYNITGKWVGFLDFPDAQNHQVMFKGSVLEPISRFFGSNAAGFTKAARALGGEEIKMGDLGFLFKIFPKLPVAVSLYLADDEFPASANMVFDRAVVGQINSPNIYTIGCELARKLCGTKL